MRSMDLNCDLGESDINDGVRIEQDLLETITSANIACGGHAGDARTMHRTITLALARGVALGAHPGYPDRQNFGRLSVSMAPAEIESTCFEQISALDTIARSCGGNLSHIKTHGALYHDAMTNDSIAAAIGRAVHRLNPHLIMVGFPHARALTIWREQGFKVVTEAFADRTYEPDGSLRKRTLPNALITDPATAAAQALSLATAPSPPDTLCIHSDTANSPDIARAVSAALTTAGISIKSPGAA